MPKPYNDCYDDLSTADKFDSNEFRQTIGLNYTYQQQQCLKLAIQSYYMTYCSCVDSYFSSYLNIRACTTLNDSTCTYNTNQKIYNEGIYQKLIDKCPLECTQSSYKFTTSISDFPSDSYADWLLSDSKIVTRLQNLYGASSVDLIKKSMVWITVYFDETKYTLISELPSQTAVDLMGSIGGTLGLYIGISFLSFIELVEIILQIAFIVYGNKKRGKISPVERKLSTAESTEEKENNEIKIKDKTILEAINE